MNPGYLPAVIVLLVVSITTFSDQSGVNGQELLPDAAPTAQVESNDNAANDNAANDNAGSAAAQDAFSQDDALQRVERLEQRVRQLEAILFSTAELNVARAERRLAEMKLAVKESERLFAQGMLSNVQLQTDQFNVQQSFRELQLAHSGAHNRQIACEIAVAAAVNNVRIAIERLEYHENLAARGYATPAQVERYQNEVELLKLTLEAEQTKLRAIKELDKLDELDRLGDPETKPEDPDKRNELKPGEPNSAQPKSVVPNADEPDKLKTESQPDK